MTDKTFAISDFIMAKQQLLIWSGHFSSCCFLDHHQYPAVHQKQECLVAVGERSRVKATAGNALPALDIFLKENAGQWIFGHLGFELKAETEGVPALKPDPIGFDDLYFFVPETVIRLQPGQLTISSSTGEPETIFESILKSKPSKPLQPSQKGLPIRPRITKQAYLQAIEKLRAHMLRGDCYEINFCQEFFSPYRVIEPIHYYQQLSNLSPNPFACYYRIGPAHLLCASPERYLMKTGKQVISQPIKGTAARQSQNAVADEAQRQQLLHSAKDRSENVMVVDLVRNDLSKCCEEGSVKVEELFGIYTYPQVHQMISTVSGTLKTHTTLTDLIRASFPMGSMTGAPKKRVLELIEQYESSRRGLFSGSVGYITPNGDFDFNVVIRSILYNEVSHYLSFLVGGGITWYSQAEKEYEECLLKAMALNRLLEHVPDSATP